MNTARQFDGQIRGARHVALGDMVFDRDRSVLIARGKPVRLEPKVGAVLSILIEHGMSPVTRDELLGRIWDATGSDEALTQAVSRLRRIAGDAALIETIPRVGYQLAVTPVPATAAPDRVPAQPKTGAFRHIRASHVYSFAGGAASMAFVALLLFAIFIKREIEIETHETVPAAGIVQAVDAE